MAAQQLLDLVANVTACPCFRVTVRVRFFIKLFIVRHMAAQQLLDLVANATAGPCFRVRGLGLGFRVRFLGLGFRVFHHTC